MRLLRTLRENSWSLDSIIDTPKGKRFGKILKHLKPLDAGVIETLLVHYGSLQAKPLLIAPTALGVLENGSVCLVYDLNPDTLAFHDILESPIPRPAAQVYGLLSLLRALTIDTTSSFQFIDFADFVDVGSLLHFFVPPPLSVFSEKITEELELFSAQGKSITCWGPASPEIPASAVVTATLISRFIVRQNLAGRVEVSESVLRWLSSFATFGADGTSGYNQLKERARQLKIEKHSETFRIDFAEKRDTPLNSRILEVLKSLDSGIVGLIGAEPVGYQCRAEDLFADLVTVEGIHDFDVVIHGQTLGELLSKYVLATDSFDVVSTYQVDETGLKTPSWLKVSEEIEKWSYKTARRIAERAEKVLFLSDGFETLDLSLKGFYDELPDMIKTLRGRDPAYGGKCLIVVTAAERQEDFSVAVGIQNSQDDRGQSATPDDRSRLEQFNHSHRTGVNLEEKTQLALAKLVYLGPSFMTTEFALFDEMLRGVEDGEQFRIDLAGIIEAGLLKFSLSGYTFSEHALWGSLYDSKIANAKRPDPKICESLALEYPTFLPKLRAFARSPLAVSLVLLKFVRAKILKCERVLMLKRIIRELRSYLKDRESYAYYWTLVNLAWATSEPKLLAETEIPSKRLYRTLRIKRLLLLGDAQTALKELEKCNSGDSERYCPGRPLRYSDLRDRFLEVLVRGYMEKLDDSIISSLRKAVVNMKEKNELEAYLKLSITYFLARRSRDSSERLRHLKLAERLGLKHGFKCRLPEIYNSLSISVGALSLKMSYLKKAVRYAEENWLPRKGLDAKANLALHALSVGDLGVFERSVRELLFDSSILNVSDKVEYANFLMALYHAYNCDAGQARKFLNELEKENTDFSSLDKLCVLLVLRDFNEMKSTIDKIPYSVRRDYDKFLQMVEAVGTPAFPEKWLDFSLSQEKYYREEVLSIFGFELAKYLPFKVREELELLQNNFFSNGEMLPQALIDEAWGHYYKALEKPLSAAWYYEKAIKKFTHIGLRGAAQRIERENRHVLFPLRQAKTDEFSTESEQAPQEATAWFTEEITDLMSSLNPFVDLPTYLQYLLLKAEKFFSRRCSIKLRDEFLDEEWVVSSDPFQIDAGWLGERKVRIQTISFKVDENSHVEFSFSSEVETPLNKISQKHYLTFKCGAVTLLKSALRIFRSTRDPLTRLYNRYYLEESLRYFFNSARRLGRNFVLILGDLDNFKDINDRYGHLAGDEVLRKVAKVMRTQVRSSDIVARYGGDEFTVIVPDISLEEGLLVAERLRCEVSAVDSPIPVSMSFGVVKMDNTTRYPNELLELADSALYKAKHSGKNVSVVLDS